MVSPEYFAGLFDGEGCVILGLHKTSITRHLTVGNIDLALIEELKDTFGGNVYSYPAKKEQWRDVHYWRVSGDAARDVALQILPHARIKREQLELFVRSFDIAPVLWGGTRVAGERLRSEDVLAQFRIMIAEMKEMKWAHV